MQESLEPIDVGQLIVRGVIVVSALGIAIAIVWFAIFSGVSQRVILTNEDRNSCEARGLEWDESARVCRPM